MTGVPIKLLLDEHIRMGLRDALTQRGYDVIHLHDTGQRGIDDESLLVFAVAQDRAVLTYNIRHFVPLVRLWYEAGRAHAGVILSVQLPPGELLKQAERLLVLRTAITAPVWRGESACFCVRSRSGNWVHIAAELY